MTERFNIIPAKTVMLDQMHEIEKALFAETAWSKEQLRQEITAENRCYLALSDESEKIVGYGGVLVIGEDADIQTMAVKKEHSGKGNGRAVLRALLNEAARRGARRVFLEVREDNPGARHLYESEGFQTIAVRERYYQPEGINALVMLLNDLRGEKKDEE